MKHLRRHSGVVGLLLALAPTSTRAAPCPPGLDTMTAKPRLQYIRDSMRVGAHRSRIWAASWGAAYGAASVALFATASQVSGPVRRDLYVGGASAALGALVRTVSVPRVIGSHRRLERALASGQSTCDALKLAEEEMHRSARSERFGRSLLIHLGSVVYGVGMGVVLGVALDRPLSGIRQATVGMTLAQVMILTQPVTMVDAARHYRDGDLEGGPPRYLRPLTLRGGGGLAWGGRF